MSLAIFATTIKRGGIIVSNYVSKYRRRQHISYTANRCRQITYI